MTGASGVCGGIASANLNVLIALTQLAEQRQLDFTVLSLLEREADRPSFLPGWVDFIACRRSRSRFVARLLGAVVRRPLCCFDHVRLALPVLPLAAVGGVRSVIFAHGSESWRRVRRTSRWSFQCATLCIANSHYTLEKMRQHVPPFRGEACPLGLSPEVSLNEELEGRGDEVVELEAADGRSRVLGERALLLVGRMDPGEREK
ncbi:MAG: hypothetical protein IH968_03890, partial [Gemmatimonadetes bacterium]|nr:hypothetical protein [Gemmatimonadota bacterium]